ncbi:MAG TPA: hypothetical protein VJH37_00045 [Candidatus Nanoarchaeia archaeon]|nr:hypothetical protein [Candidatus Nanoarchaeia archaeon]
MKRGQAEVRQILLVFEIILVLVVSIYFYQTIHQHAQAPPRTYEQQLSDLASRSAFGVTHLRPVSQPLTSQQKNEETT